MMKRIFVWLFVTLLCMQVSSVFAQDAKILEKSHKDLMKSLKKQLGLKDVSVKVEKDGFWYFLLSKKDGGQLVYGVANQSGKIIIPVFQNQIFYFPAMEAGTGKIPCYNEAGNFVEYMDIHYDKSDAVFLAKHDKASLYSSDGKLLRNFDSSLISYLPGYFVVGIEKQMTGVYLAWEANGYKYISKGLTINKQRNNLSLFTYTGKELINSAKKISFNKEGNCTYTKYVENTVREGGFTQKNHSQQIPCLFYRTRFHNNEWYVQKNSNSQEEIFDVNKNYSINYRDKGEEYFEKRMYDSVIRFYANEGINAPWAKFFTATALYHKSFTHRVLAKSLSEDIENNNLDSYTYIANSKESFDLDLAVQQLSSSISLIDKYLEEDSTYLNQAKSIRTQANISLEEIPSIKQRYEKALALLKQRKEEQRLAEIKRQQEAQQRETEIMMGFLKIFANALAGNSGSSNSSSYSSGGGTYNSTTTSSSSSSRGINKSKLADWQSRKANAERLLEDYREQLRKNPNDAALKSKIRNQEGVLRTCNEQISLIESGQIY